MKKQLSYFAIYLFAFAILTACSSTNKQTEESSLARTFGDQFLIGAALNTSHFTGQNPQATDIIKRHFNSIVAENCMKHEEIHPEENRYNFNEADSFIDFGQKHGMSIIGHCLIWHSQCASWFYTDEKGNLASPEVLKKRMKDHITTLVSRYKGKVKGWDVVNEAIVEDGSYRKTPFHEILGEEFIPLAFQYAHEADPDAELYLNDYGMNVPGRRDAYVRLIKDLQQRGIRIDAIGMQGHMGMDYPTLAEFETSLLAFSGTGIKVMITEWDMSALPTVRQTANISDTLAFRKAMNPYPNGLPDSVSTAWNQRMKDFFHLFLKHADKITRVTAWGVTDGESWKNDFPVRGRTEYPLLFDRSYQPKPFVKELLKEQKQL